MGKILEALLIDFFNDAFPLSDIIFGKLIDIVFWVENHLSDGSIFENTVVDSTKSQIFFDKLFLVTTGFGIAFLVFKFLKKVFDIYIIGSDGDASVSIENSLIGFCKALIITFSFNWLYTVFVNISVEFINDMLKAAGEVTITSLSGLLDGFLSLGLFMLFALLAFFICYLLLIFQFIKRGIEMLLLRLGVPLACAGLIDSDNGVFPSYMKLFIQNSITVLIQLFLMTIGFTVTFNGNIFFGIGAMVMGLKTPQFIQQFMIGTGSSGINMMNINQTASMISRVSRFIKK